MAKSTYKEVLEGIKGSSRFSKNDFTKAATALLNSEDYEKTVYVKDGDTTSTVVIKPSYDFRESLKPVLKSLGLDSNETEKIHDVTFPTATGEALYNLSTTLIRDYADTGRMFAFPMYGEDEAQMSIKVERAKERTVPTRTIVQEGDKFVSVPTGKTSTTMEHSVIKGVNKVPKYLKK